MIEKYFKILFFGIYYLAVLYSILFLCFGMAITMDETLRPVGTLLFYYSEAIASILFPIGIFCIKEKFSFRFFSMTMWCNCFLTLFIFVFNRVLF